MHVDCLPDLIQLSCLLPQKEDNLRNRTTKVSSTDWCFYCLGHVCFCLLFIILKIVPITYCGVAVLIGCI